MEKEETDDRQPQNRANVKVVVMAGIGQSLTSQSRLLGCYGEIGSIPLHDLVTHPEPDQVLIESWIGEPYPISLRSPQSRYGSDLIAA
ncbi:hypothetical protein A3194_13075 [Candidatus Thiodiazotropha endoloripes]|nr:hypothetical protein A3194_13075 [Candidatus Thiodiazotropha endoloripes]